MLLRAGRRRYDERGIALPSPVAMLSVAAVVLAGVAFVSTNGEPDNAPDAARPVTADPSSTPTPSRTAPKPVVTKDAQEAGRHQKLEKTKQEKLRQEQRGQQRKRERQQRSEVRRDDVFVEVYNNSGISGLAGSTASVIAGAGWQVVGSDNWYGTIPASTVYYPDRLEDQARLLGKDLGIVRLKPAISPMRLDRLTVILTADYS